MKHTRKLLALAVIIACAVAACGDGSGDGGGGGGGGNPPGPCGHTPCNCGDECPGLGSCECDKLDFTQTANATKIFGASLPHLTSAPTTFPISGANVITLMNERFRNANTSLFYPIIDASADSTSVPGVSFRHERVYGADPMIAFLMDGNRMRIFGGSTGQAGTEKKITFDVSVINGNGMGWLKEGENRGFVYPHLSDRVETASISISSLTNGKLSNVSELSAGNYRVYVIVRSTTGVAVTDFNTSASTIGNYLCTRNVIRVYPDPYSL